MRKKLKLTLLLVLVCILATTLAACITVNAKQYTITYNVGKNATEISTEKHFAGEVIRAPKDPERKGYKFCGWQLDGKDFVFDTMPAADLQLVAVWRRYYTVIYNTGEKIYADQYLPGEQIQPPQDPVRNGYLFRGWKLDGEDYTFGTMPEQSLELTAAWMKVTVLPAMFINLTDANGDSLPLASVTKEAYVTSSITVANAQQQFVFNDVKASFKGRGNGSWGCAKKGYKIKFDKKQSLFGRAANKHWVVIACANFDDPTMNRNYLAYNMADQLFDGIEYSTNAVWVDLYVNGEYRGVYVLCEHVRVGSGRVDIPSEYGVENTGYLVEYDSYAEGEEGVDYFRIPGVKYPFSLHSPDPEDYSTDGNISKQQYKAQVAYIQDYVSRVYAAALGKDYATFCSLADVDSFVDMYILHEFFKNVDAGWSSFYLYKKPNGKLYAGPPWDFDGTTNIPDRGDRTPQGLYVAETVLDTSNHTASELLIALYHTEGFLNAVKARWKVLSPQIQQFLDDNMNNTVYQTYREAMGQNFALWYNKPQSVAESDWVEQMKILKNWLVQRRIWLDGTWAQ